MIECENCGHYDPQAGYSETCPHCKQRYLKSNVWYEKPVYVAPKLSKEKCLERRDLASQIMDDMQSFLSEHPEYICDTLKDAYQYFKTEAELYDTEANT